jgi:L-alanine-DL-glutamate epimerase-like enolase superfamily enzyme
MKITSVNSVLLRVPTRRLIADSHNVLENFEAVLALLGTDEGISGTGYTLTVGYGGHLIREAIEAFVNAYGPTAKPFVWRKREVKGSQLRNTIVNLCN